MASSSAESSGHPPGKERLQSVAPVAVIEGFPTNPRLPRRATKPVVCPAALRNGARWLFGSASRRRCSCRGPVPRPALAQVPVGAALALFHCCPQGGGSRVQPSDQKREASAAWTVNGAPTLANIYS